MSLRLALIAVLLTASPAGAASQREFYAYPSVRVIPHVHASYVRPIWPWWLVLGLHYDVFGVHAFDRDDLVKN